MENVLSGKSAIVTGAASGIGQATAELYADQEAKMLLADIREESLKQVKDTILARGAQAIAVKADLGKIG